MLTSGLKVTLSVADAPGAKQPDGGISSSSTCITCRNTRTKAHQPKHQPHNVHASLVTPVNPGEHMPRGTYQGFVGAAAWAALADLNHCRFLTAVGTSNSRMLLPVKLLLMSCTDAL